MKNFKTLALAVAIAVPCSFAVASPATSKVDKTVAKAQAGNVQAQVKLGFNYRDGTNGFPMDLDKSADWFMKAAKAGNAEAQVELAVTEH